MRWRGFLVDEAPGIAGNVEALLGVVVAGRLDCAVERVGLGSGVDRILGEDGVLEGLGWLVGLLLENRERSAMV